jgi:hypothetical protein
MTFIKFFNQIKIYIPINRHCVGCKHYLITGPMKLSDIDTETSIYSTAKCTKIMYHSSDTGKVKYEYAYIARSDDTMCGPYGLNYEPIVRTLN